MIDVKGIARAAANTAFEIFRQVQDAGTFYRVTPGTYDPQTGTDPSSTTATAVTAIFGVFEQEQLESRMQRNAFTYGELIKAGDEMILIRVSELPTAPGRDDYYVDANGKRWDLFLIRQESTKTLWVLRGRAHVA